MIAHAGPFYYNTGTLTADGKDYIFLHTGCSCSIRERNQWGKKRGLTVNGPAKEIDKAVELADMQIRGLVTKVEAQDPQVRINRIAYASAQQAKTQGAASSSSHLAAWDQHAQYAQSVQCH